MKSDSGNIPQKQKEDILNKIPIFLAKTFRINPQYKEIISWTPEGDSFVVKNISRLTTEVFPQHFKHNNFLSFIRQLNMYGFHKLVTNSDQEGALFHHDYFKRDDLSKLSLIKRKTVSQESSNNENQNQLVPVSNRQQRLQKQVLLLRSQHEELQSMMEVLMEQNKTITAQNKAFLNVMGDMREKYRKKLETLMLLFFFGKKNKPDGDFLFPPHFNNVIQAFEEMNIANPHMYPKKKKSQQQLMITENGEHPFFDPDKSQVGSHVDKEESEDIFKVLVPLKSKRSVSHVDEEEKVEKDDHSEGEWKDGIPISPFSVRSRPQRIAKGTAEWDDYWNRIENSDYSELELQKHQ